MQIWTELVGEGELVNTQVQKTALVILWMAMRSDDVTDICSNTYAEAARLMVSKRRS